MEPPRSEQFDDVYFSAHDGMAETRYVFLGGNNLPARWYGKDHVTIAETGFGTGLNFFTTWKLFDEHAPPHAVMDYISFEKYPLTRAQIQHYLSPWRADIGAYVDVLCASYPIRAAGYHRIVLNPRVILTLIFDDVNVAIPTLNMPVDTWFLDGFTPAKNPDMWTDNLFIHMARLSHAETTLATFTSAGFVKRGLESVGFEMQKTKGFAHKREMLTGVFKSKEKSPKPYMTGRKIAVIGGGLAGCAMAYTLKEYGFVPTLYECGASLAGQASGNLRGLYNPRLSALRGMESDFYASSYALVCREFQKFFDVDFSPCGALHLITDADKEKRFTRTAENWHWHNDHMQILNADESSDIAGVKINHAALYLPDSGYVSPPKLCAAYVGGIDVKFNQQIDDLSAIEADYIIVCNSMVAQIFFPNLPIHTVRGQITYTTQNNESTFLKTNICYGGYVSPARDGVHVVGSSFQRWLTHTELLDEDNIGNLEKLKTAVPTLAFDKSVGARAALRCSSHDRFPVMGHVRDNIYVSTAHGSHGLISTLMAGHVVADGLRGAGQVLPEASLKALSPQRFFT